jgi:hypothetical protein
MNKSVISRAHRTLKHLTQYKSLVGETLYDLPEDLRSVPLVDQDNEHLIGLYENYPGHPDDNIVITNLGLYLYHNNSWTITRYSDIVRISPPEDKQSKTMLIYTGEGVQKLYVRGGSGKFSDVFEFMHFLQRVTDAVVEEKE